MSLSKSGYLCKCPLCGYSTYHDYWFAKHVETMHSPFKIFKKYYGPCQTLVRGSGEFNCSLCNSVVKHISTAVEAGVIKVQFTEPQICHLFRNPTKPPDES